MRKLAAVAATVGVLFATLAGCDSDAKTPSTSTPTKTVTTTKAPDVGEHESGPESPLTFGLQVPQGATQLGPLVRSRSAALIAAYRPELDAALAQKEADRLDKVAEAEQSGTPLPSPTLTPETGPSPDTFKLIDEPPKPDTTISLMRIDGKPSDVVRRMLAQISAALPTAGIVTDDLSKYCAATERRITSCRLVAQGPTSDERDLRISMTVDPGSYTTRTAPPSSLTRPVMTVAIQYVGEPRKGQLKRESSTLDNVPDIKSDGDVSGLIWPSMDEDAPATKKLVHGWTAPTNATILLSGFRPQFVTVTAKRAVDADAIAQQFVVSNSDKGAFTKDVVEDLNEVSTTYVAVNKDGAVASATYVLSARGNYTTLFYTPAAKRSR